MPVNYSPAEIAGDFHFNKVDYSLGFGASERVLESDPHRVLIVILATQSGNTGFAPESITNEKHGVTTSSSAAAQWLTYSDFGALLGFSWFATSTSGGIGRLWTLSYKPKRRSLFSLRKPKPCASSLLESVRQLSTTPAASLLEQLRGQSLSGA